MHNSLLSQLILRDLKLRYRRPALGFFWSFLSPFLTVLIFYLVFACFLKVSIAEAPFLLYLMTSVFTWGFFQGSVSACATSLMDSRNLIKEARFPHYLIPISIVLANAVNFLPALIIIIISALILLKGLPGLILFLPAVLLIQLSTTIGIGIIVSLFYLRCRDTKYILDALLTLLFYLTPVFYSLSLVKDSLPRTFFLLYLNNPFVGVLNFYRICLLRGFYGFVRKDAGLLNTLVIPAAFAFLVLMFAFWLYAKQKKKINDYLSY
ncbi:MAG: ABC transporter permease [Candidatus Omnitrophota bacterium]|nr:ABC transporter permease [Candidatus Omnitrophota bacterium]